MLAMAQHRRPALLKVQSAPAADGPRMVESMGALHVDCAVQPVPPAAATAVGDTPLPLSLPP